MAMRTVTWIVSIFALLIRPVSATDYFVAPGGNDDHIGSLNQPWRTIQKAAATLQAGDTVFIRAGTYQERVQPQSSGTAGAPITYCAYPGETVIIDGSSITLPADWGGLFEISSLSYLQVSGLQIHNAGPNDNSTGILVAGSSHIVIAGNRTYNTTSSGIAVWGGSDVLLDGNEVELACNDGEQECITVAGTAGFEIRNNHVHHGGLGSMGGEGIDVKDGSSNGTVHGNRVHDLVRLGIYVDSWDKYTSGIEVFANLVYRCADGIVLAAENGGILDDVKVYNNVAYANQFSGIVLAGWGEPVPAHPMQNLQLVNNTLVDNGASDWGGGILSENPDITTLLIRNNLCSQNASFQIAFEVPAADLTVDHNLIDGFRGEEGEVYGDASQTGDPLFVDRAGHDYRLQEGSPAIDNGASAQAPAIDYDGAPRPQYGGWDIGAFEYPPAIFRDGFESGDTSAWSAAVG